VQVVWAIIVGAIAGFIARWISPSPNNPLPHPQHQSREAVFSDNQDGCRRSTSGTIAAFASIRPGVSVDNPLAACFACRSRMAM
jgi:hypothetical protein